MASKKNTLWDPGLALRCAGKVLSLIFFSGMACAQQDQDLTQMSMEQLSKVEVTSVSKKEQKLSDVASAVFVITQQDIRNSAATNIPELLRMAPGLDVAQISGSRWAISARGFAEQYADKILVLIDGRSVFDPLFNGVMWSEQEVLLEDIERIEVVRGPGATVWGTNAVNGVVNIITKHSKDTQGVLVTAGVNDDGRSFGAARYGGTLGKSTSYRIHTDYAAEGPAGNQLGKEAHDSLHSLDGEFRLDSNASDHDFLMFSGRIFRDHSGIDTTGFSYTPPYNFTYIDSLKFQGGNLLGRWIHKSLNGSETTLQTSFGRVLHPQKLLDVSGDTAAISIQHDRSVGTRHNFTLGAEYDYRTAHTSFTAPVVWWSPADPSIHTANGFVQDEILLAGGAVHFTTGLRLEHNSLSGLALEPNARLLWKMNSKHSLWLAYSRAARTTAPTDTGLNLNIRLIPQPAGPPLVLRLLGNPDLRAEKLNAFELGYRAQPRKQLLLDIAAFYNQYSGVIGAEATQPFFEAGPPNRVVLPLTLRNDTSGGTFGGELSVKWQPVQRAHLAAAYSFIGLSLDQRGATAQNFGKTLDGGTPRHQFAMNSSFNLTPSLVLNNALKFVDRRTFQNVPGYSQLDSSLIWRVWQVGEFKAGVNNALNKEHIEFISTKGGLSTTVDRSFYGKVTWHF